MVIADIIGGYLTLFLVVLPLIALLGFWLSTSWREDKQRTAAIVERQKAATEFYRLACQEMKSNFDGNGVFHEENSVKGKT